MKFIYLNCGMKKNVKKILAEKCKEDPRGIAEVRVRIPASLIFSGFLFATA